MLNLIPLEFWKTKKKVFEPCAGKGGFLIDIIDKFMVGLDIKDEKEKYIYPLILYQSYTMNISTSCSVIEQPFYFSFFTLWL